jgi:hypothetical protein
MSEKTKFWILLGLLLLSIAFAIVLNTSLNRVLLSN